MRTASSSCAKLDGKLQDQAFADFVPPIPIDEAEFLCGSFSPPPQADDGQAPMDASFMDVEDGKAIAALADALPECSALDSQTEEGGDLEEKDASG
eukprot:3935972-Rhodomonas_salina.1